MALLKQSTARERAVFMVDSTDHVSGKTGLTLTITAGKNGGALSSITPTVTERSNGWYTLSLTTSHTDTLGDFTLHITGTGADPTDLVDEVVVDLPGVGSGPSAATIADAVWDEARSGHVAAGSFGEYVLADSIAISGDTVAADRLETMLDGTGGNTLSATLSDLESILADSIPADGTRPTVKQALYMLVQFMLERQVVGTTMTVRKVDGSTSLFTLTLSPDGVNPTQITRAT